MKRSRRYLTLLFLLLVFALAAQAGERITLTELRANTHIHGIAVHPKDSKQLYLATHHGVFLVSPDGWATRVSSNSNEENR